jgi:long-chain fatty acid transport protein
MKPNHFSVIARPARRLPVAGIVSALLLSSEGWHTRANGIYRNGIGAESMSMGGTETGWANSPLGALAANPAGLGFLETGELNAGVGAATPEGHYQKSPTANGHLDGSLRAFPEGAIAYPFQKIPVTLGLSFIPVAAQVGDWDYFDSPGGLGGVSYGQQQHRSEIQLLRTALGVGVKVNSQWSVCASVGLLYNENRLRTPYIFQNLSPNPNLLNGAKALLDLETAGYGYNVQAGILFRATTNLQFGLAYTCESTVDTTGDATGDPYAQFGVAPGTLAFHYDADVRNTFPQEVSLGMSWKFHPQWRLALQVDWLNWSAAFNSLPVKLSNGSNPGVNGALGANFSDSVPMNWSDEFVYRAGLEYNVTENLSLRAGYCYGQSPVPDSTLSPMTAAIMEHTLTAGIGYKWKNCAINLAYQYDLPTTRHVGTSDLRSGEYSNSSTEVQIHWVALTTSVKF